MAALYPLWTQAVMRKCAFATVSWKVHCMLATENNRISLSMVFFPLEDNQPEFVTIRYSFNGSNKIQVWFWSTQMSHFLHPFEVFQFLSFFFTKPEPYYTGSLDIMLKAECANLSSTDVKLQLLTQRVSRQ